jgi:hypothetical protein
MEPLLFDDAEVGGEGATRNSESTVNEHPLI